MHNICNGVLLLSDIVKAAATMNLTLHSLQKVKTKSHRQCVQIHRESMKTCFNLNLNSLFEMSNDTWGSHLLFLLILSSVSVAQKISFSLDIQGHDKKNGNPYILHMDVQICSNGTEVAQTRFPQSVSVDLGKCHSVLSTKMQ